MKKIILICLLFLFGCNNSKSDIGQKEVLYWKEGWNSKAIEELVAEISDSFCAKPFDISCSEFKELSRCIVESFAYSLDYSSWERFRISNIEESDFTDSDWEDLSQFIDLRSECINSLNFDSDVIIRDLEDDERRFNEMKQKFYKVK